MDPDFYKHFIQSTKATFNTMANLAVNDVEPIVDDTYSLHGDISGVVGFAGSDIFGSVSLCFPKESAFYIYQKMMGEPVNEINADVLDIIGELANIVAGGAKVSLSQIGISYHISIPSVVEGIDHVIRFKPDTQYVIIPFKMDNQMEFSLVISKKL